MNKNDVSQVKFSEYLLQDGSLLHSAAYEELIVVNHYYIRPKHLRQKLQERRYKNHQHQPADEACLRII